MSMVLRENNNSSRIYRLVFDFVEKERLLKGVSNLLIAVSGGPDSLALLELLKEIRAEFGVELSVAHFDHKLRDNSKGDLDFVREICGTANIKFISGEGDVQDAIESSGGSLEEIARKMRYDFLAFAAERHLAEAVATGHTYEDLAETVLQRILRGTGIRGVQGILPESPLPSAPSIRLIRPLLNITHQDTEVICTQAGLVPRRDPSNQSTDMQRTRLRNVLLPALKNENPSIEDALVSLSLNARDLFSLVTQMSDRVQPLRRTLGQAAFYDGKEFLDLPTEARFLIIEREASILKIASETNRTKLENLTDVLNSGNGKVVFGDIEIQVSTGVIRIGKPLEEQLLDDSEKIIDLPGTTRFRNLEVNISAAEKVNSPLQSKMASGPFEGALRLRRIAKDDQMLFQGKYRKMKEIFSQARVPIWDRQEMIVLADLKVVHAILGPDYCITENPAVAESFYISVKTYEK